MEVFMKVEKKEITLLNKLHLINETYRDCFSDEPHLFNALRAEDGSKRMDNHILYDVMDITIDSWCCIEDMRMKVCTNMTKGEYLLCMHGFFQCMYVQQDLMDELFWICKISNDEASNKRKPIRDIRNELIGHPINTEYEEGIGKKLVSTAVWCYPDVGKAYGINSIGYLYRIHGSSLKQERKSYLIKDIIILHEEYMNYCLDIVLEVFQKHLHRQIYNKHAKVIDILSQEVYQSEKLKTAAKLIASEKMGCFQAWNKLHGYYSEGNLLKAIDKMDEAPRYRLFVDNYFKEVTELLTGDGAYLSYYSKIGDAQDGIKKMQVFDDNEFPQITLVCGKGDKVIDERKNLKEETRYYISKLFEKKYYSDIDILRKMLEKFPNLLEELDHMDEHWSADKTQIRNDDNFERASEMEYYAAILYLQYMIEEITKYEEVS